MHRVLAGSRARAIHETTLLVQHILYPFKHKMKSTRFYSHMSSLGMQSLELVDLILPISQLLQYATTLWTPSLPS